MTRFKSIAIEISHSEIVAELTNQEEELEFWWKGRKFNAVEGIANIYEIIRSDEDGLPIGVELQLGRPIYDDKLRPLKGFKKLLQTELSAHNWVFQFRAGSGHILWEQSLTNNPFLSEDGHVLLLLSLWHLNDDEYAVFNDLANPNASD